MDLYAVNMGTTNQLFQNNGDGTFTDIAGSKNADTGAGSDYPAVFFDIEGDGDLDLVVGYYSNAANKVLRWDGGGSGFTDVTSSAFVSGNTGSTQGAAACDYDGDGDLDARQAFAFFQRKRCVCCLP